MKLARLQSQIVRMERQKKLIDKRIQAHRARAYADLPASVGLGSVDELFQELIPLVSTPLKKKLGLLGARNEVALVANAKSSARPGRYSSELKEKIKADLARGGKTDQQVADEYGVSKASVILWKRSWGLTNPRAKRKK